MLKIWVLWMDRTTPQWFIADNVAVNNDVLVLSKKLDEPHVVALPKGTNLVHLMEDKLVLAAPVRHIRAWWADEVTDEDLEEFNPFYASTMKHPAL